MNNISKNILIVGVNPFEDLVGYQILGLLNNSNHYNVYAADDSEVAVAILKKLGKDVKKISHPFESYDDFYCEIKEIVLKNRIDLIIPGNDASFSVLLKLVKEDKEISELCPIVNVYDFITGLGRQEIQDWLGDFLNIPERYPFPKSEKEFSSLEKMDFPIVVKGGWKGGQKANHIHDVISIKDHLMENKANLQKECDVYLEKYIDGEEYATLFVFGKKGKLISAIRIKKLATTQLGTTTVAEIQEFDNQSLINKLSFYFDKPGVIELESRKDHSGTEWFFEANLRFPTWIGALDNYGEYLINEYLKSFFEENQEMAEIEYLYINQLLYRLPESGICSLENSFPHKKEELFWSVNRRESHNSSPSLLWPASAPHQFLSK